MRELPGSLGGFDDLSDNRLVRRLALGMLVVVPFALNWRLVFAEPQNQLHQCCDFAIYHFPAYLEGATWIAGGPAPHWIPFGNLGGTSLLADPMLGFLYPPHWVVFAVGSIVGDGLYLRVIYAFLIGHIVVAGVATTLLARSFTSLDWPFALVAGLAFQSTGFINRYVVSPPILIGFTLAPVVLYCWDRALRDDDGRFAGAAAITLGFSLLGGYQFTPAFVTGPLLIVLWLYRYPPWRTERETLLRHGTWLSLVVVLSLGTFAVQAVPSFVAYQSSYRPAASLAWSSSYNIGFASLYQLFLPSMREGFWAYYAGLLPIAMMGIAALRPDLRDSRVTLSVAVAVAGLFLAMGAETLVHHWAFLTVPSLGRWRSIYQFFLWFVVFGSISTGAVAQRIAEVGYDESLVRQVRKAFVWLLAPVLVCTLGLWTLQSGVLDQVLNGTGGDAIVTAWVAFALTLAVVLFGVYSYVHSPDRRYVAILVVVLVLDAGIHVPLIEHRTDVSPHELFEGNELTATLSESTGTGPPSRVAFETPLPYRKYAGPFRFHPLAGYDALPPPESQRLKGAMYGRPEAADAFNVEFRVTPKELDSPGSWERVAAIDSTEGYWQLQHGVSEWTRSEPTMWVYRNPDRRSRAFAVPEVRTAPASGYSSQLDTLEQIDPRRTAVVDPDAVPKWYAADSSSGTNATVTITDYSRQEIRMHVDSSSPTFVLVSDAYHPWWTATVDGEATEVHRTDARFRGVFVEEGTHTVVMRFDLTPFYLGALGSLLSVLAAGAMIAYYWRFADRTE